MNVRPRHAAAAAAIALASATPSVATEGNLYLQGPPATAFHGSQALITSLQAGGWQVELPAANPSEAGDKWAVSWGCPVAGSELAAVHWDALRWATFSSLAAEVVTFAGIEAHIPDAHMPQSPNGGAHFSYAFPPGRCGATLRLRQTERVPQPRRIYWIGNPHVYVRDLTPPSVVMRSVTPGWLNASTNDVAVNWSAADNFGNDGMGLHSVWIAGLPKWSGIANQGDSGVVTDLTGVGDGAQTVLVDVAGDGTASGHAAATIYVDRTAPSASAPDAHATVTPGVATVNWQTADLTSGVSSTQLEVNTASDGTLTGEWRAVGPAIAGGGIHSASVDLTAFGNGHHAIRARVTDRAGNVGVSSLGRVVVDTMPPTVTFGPTPTQHVRTLTLDVTVGDNLAPHWGLGATRIEANSAPDGSQTGAWISLRPPEVLRAGAHRVVMPLTGLVDGVHLVRVATTNGGPLVGLVGVTTFTVSVDQTSPTVTDVRFTPAGPSRIDVGWIANDARAGVARARIEWLDTSVWRTLGDVPVANGAGLMSIDIAQLPTGPQQLRLVIADAAGNETTVQSTSAIGQDHTPPALTGVRLDGPPWRVSWMIMVPEVDACRTRVSISGPQTAGQWHEVLTTATALGPQSALLPVDGFAPGAYRVQVQVCDAVGNVATVETAGLQIGAPTGAAAVGVSAAATPASRFATARVAVRVPGVRAKSVDGRSRYTVRLGFGQRTRVTGRLLDADAVPIRNAVLETLVGDSPVGQVRTGADGTFTALIRATRSGAVRFAVDDGERIVLPTTADVTMRVSPNLTFAASRRTAVALGAPVVFSGRVTPGPAQRVGTHRKTVVLEWRDPVRRTWRPVINTTLRDDGTYRIAWRFQARGQRIPMRLRVPFELGWGLDERTSRPITITVK